MFLGKVNFFRLKSGGKNLLFRSTFALAPHKFFQHSSSPYIRQHQITTLFLQEIRIIRSNYSCYYTYELTPVDDSPAVLVPNAISLTFFQHTRVYQAGSSNSLDNGPVTIIALLLSGVNCDSDKRIFRIFSSELFNC